MYNKTRKIFGLEENDFSSPENDYKPFMRRPVKFLTASEGIKYDDESTDRWSIVHVIDNLGYCRVLVPPNTPLHTVSRPVGTPNYTDYIPPEKTCQKNKTIV